MRIHPCAAIPALTLALLLGTAAPGQAQQPKKGTRDFARLMPASSLLYVEMNHPQLVKQLLGMIKGSALADYAGFRDDLYQRLKIEAASEGKVTRPSAFLACVLTPELLDEIGRIQGFAVTVTGVKEGDMSPQTDFVWAIDPGTSNLVPLIARDILTLSASMKSVRKVEGVRLYQSFQPNRKVQKARNGIHRVESAANNYLRENKSLLGPDSCKELAMLLRSLADPARPAPVRPETCRSSCKGGKPIPPWQGAGNIFFTNRDGLQRSLRS
jgi:hypothetical protein